MKIIIDMNLSPDWVQSLAAAGHHAVHWSTLGRPNESDARILEQAARESAVVLTADLDFGDLLAASGAAGPSVVILRSPDKSPAAAAVAVLNFLRIYESELHAGALVSVDVQRGRVRLLPLRSGA